MRVEPIVLADEHLRLEPLTLDHAESLRAIAEEDYFKFYISLQPRSLAPDDWRQFIEGQLAFPKAQTFVATSASTGEVLGSSTYLDIREEHRGLEVGFTWIARQWWGTWVNPAMKRLMLSHAFDDLGCIRVQLKTDSRNVHSRAAIMKLGAKYEGTLRSHGIQANGYVRDTVMFSILDREWPEVRAALDERLRLLAQSPR